MKFLLDTHILLWAAYEPDKLPLQARTIIATSDNDLFFSPASLWEIAIKKGLGRKDFRVELPQFRRALIDNGYMELPISSAHAIRTESLPQIHKDPFDRMLIAQSESEGLILLTADSTIARYSGPIRLV